MKLVGMIFILAASGSVGIRMAAAMRRRCGLFRQFLAALHVLQNEITFCATPLPQAYALAAVSSEGVVARLFSHMAKEMDRRRWLTPQAALAAAWSMEPALTQEEALHTVLQSMASGLGKYDRDSQSQTLEMTKKRLEALLYEAEQERHARSKTYETLGICTGLAMAILFL